MLELKVGPRRLRDASRRCSTSRSRCVAGEAVGVIGPNGAGKTTLMRVISGLIRPTAGSIVMEGVDLVATPAHRIVELGIAHVPESRRLFPRMTVEDNLQDGRLHAVRAAEVPRSGSRSSTSCSRACASAAASSPAPCPAASSRCARSGAPSCPSPSCSCSTSPRPAWRPSSCEQVFELVKRIRAGGLTVLIVEQNVQQVLRVVDRAYLLKAGSIRAAGTRRRAAGERHDPRSLPRRLSEGSGSPMGIFDIFLLEALINGVLLGGVLALLSLGLNLVFGVIDVVWICYAELIMLGMYGMYFLYTVYHAPIVVAAVVCIAGVGILGVILHVLVIAPLLGAAPDQSAPGHRRRPVLPAVRGDRACSASSSRTSACACRC